MTATSHGELVDLCAETFRLELSKDPVLISYAYTFFSYVQGAPHQMSDVMTGGCVTDYGALLQTGQMELYIHLFLIAIYIYIYTISVFGSIHKQIIYRSIVVYCIDLVFFIL